MMSLIEAPTLVNLGFKIYKIIMNSDYTQQIKRAAEWLSQKTEHRPKLGIVLGSGLSEVADGFRGVDIPYRDIPGFPVSTVSGHKGMMRITPEVMIMIGRVHYYEGWALTDVVLPLFVMHAFGVKKLIITNAAGAVTPQLKPASLVLIRDHINLMGTNPFIGANDPELGPRFFDMTRVWDHEMRIQAQEVARAQLSKRYPLPEGVYAALPGPNYETPAEIRMLQVLGADLVGMSTVPEALAAAYLNMKALGISCVTNLGAGLSQGPLNHEEVVEVGKIVERDMQTLIQGLVARLQ